MTEEHKMTVGMWSDEFAREFEFIIRAHDGFTGDEEIITVYAELWHPPENSTVRGEVNFSPAEAKELRDALDRAIEFHDD